MCPKARNISVGADIADLDRKEEAAGNSYLHHRVQVWTPGRPGLHWRATLETLCEDVEVAAVMSGPVIYTGQLHCGH